MLDIFRLHHIPTGAEVCLADYYAANAFPLPWENLVILNYEIRKEVFWVIALISIFFDIFS